MQERKRQYLPFFKAVYEKNSTLLQIEDIRVPFFVDIKLNFYGTLFVHEKEGSS